MLLNSLEYIKLLDYKKKIGPETSETILLDWKILIKGMFLSCTFLIMKGVFTFKSKGENLEFLQTFMTIRDVRPAKKKII